MNPLLNLRKSGQSVWYDNLRRGLITSGEIKRMIDEYAVSGITSNPVIFEKAVSGTSEYDEDIARYVQQGLTDAEIADKLVVKDIRLAADALSQVYGDTGGRDGYVCIELNPHLAHDGAATAKEARRLWSRIGKPNIMIKVPGTAEGALAVEELVSEGLNINVTLLFSVMRYEEVARAYIRGLERRLEKGGPVGGVSGVASFFISRIDTLADKLLEEKAEAAVSNDEKARLKGLLGKIATAQAKLAFIKYSEMVKSDAFKRLKKEGAAPQRLLWASTSSKNPLYPDLKYAEDLIEDGTVITMPLNTLLAFYDHGKIRRRLSDDLESPKKTVEELKALGFDFEAIARTLEEDGLKGFTGAFDALVGCVARKRAALVGAGAQVEADYVLKGFETSVHSALEEIGNENFLERLWAKDATIWKTGPEERKLIKDALGWLTLPELMEANKDAITAFAAEARRAGFTNAVLLGMGGSSLAPLVLASTFGAARGYPSLTVLDSTDPDAIKAVTDSVYLDRTLFIVSSKSGTTIEPLSLFEYFYDLLYRIKGEEAGRNFIAITDPGTPLEGFSRKYRFRRLFLNPHDIGGRFSALSYFGLVPAAVAGIDVSRLLSSAADISAATHPCIREKGNPVVMLGAALGILGRSGRDKVTFFISKEVSALGLWIEQLIAESTGKEGRGLVPIVDEPPGIPADYASDRVFVHISAGEEDKRVEKMLEILSGAGHPVIRFRIKDLYEIGGEFLRWEVATSVAGQILGINPFDQPDVELSKKLARSRLSAMEKGLVAPPGVEAGADAFRVFFGKSAFKMIKGAEGMDAKRALKEFFGLVRKGDYIGVLAYYNTLDGKMDASFREIRKALRDSTKAAVQFGYGPRYLHSTGQLHKGGANKGVFLILCHEAKEGIKVPKSAFSFSELELSQAFGDMEALDSKGIRVALLSLKDSSLEALKEAGSLIKDSVAGR